MFKSLLSWNNYIYLIISFFSGSPHNSSTDHTSPSNAFPKSGHFWRILFFDPLILRQTAQSASPSEFVAVWSLQKYRLVVKTVSSNLSIYLLEKQDGSNLQNNWTNKLVRLLYLSSFSQKYKQVGQNERIDQFDVKSKSISFQAFLPPTLCPTDCLIHMEICDKINIDFRLCNSCDRHWT